LPRRSTAQHELAAQVVELCAERRKAVMQPPPRGATKLPFAGLMVVENVQRSDRRAGRRRCSQCPVVADPQVLPKPDDDWRLAHQAVSCRLALAAYNAGGDTPFRPASLIREQQVEQRLLLAAALLWGALLRRPSCPGLRPRRPTGAFVPIVF